MWAHEENCLALVDGNNFFVSCERVFDPRLLGRPVVVLSPNDGCIVSRSNEAKQIGIPMGAPFFKHKYFLERSNGVALSSNFELYGDMSDRMMECLRFFVPAIETYSIDEAFLDLRGFERAKLESLAGEIRRKVLQWTGLPISIGVAPTKILAKAANRNAKKNPALMDKGVCVMLKNEEQEEVLARMEVEDLWGISTQTGKSLRGLGIKTALQLKNADPARVKNAIGIMMEQMVRELNGIACGEIHEEEAARKNILSSRSFGSPQTQLEPIAEALAGHVAHVAQKLRQQHSRAGGMHIFLHTSRFKADEERYSAGRSVGFEEPLQDTRLMLKKAQAALKEIFQPGYTYKKVGVMLWGISDDAAVQPTLFAETEKESEKSKSLMETLDGLNRERGDRTVFLAAEGTQRTWRENRNRRSARYTTCWDELPRVS